jgi:hypothetical protein
MNVADSKKWTEEIAKRYPQQILNVDDVILDEETVMAAQSSPDKTQWRIVLKKYVEIPSVRFNRKVEKYFKKNLSKELASNRLDGMVTQGEDGSTLLFVIMIVNHVYDLAQLDGLLGQFEATPKKAKAFLENYFAA